MKIKAVLFDLDGVLVDATEWHFEALNRALKLFGYSISRYEHLTSYNGLPTRKKLEMLSIEKKLPRGLHSMLNRIKQKYTREEILTRCTPIFEKEFMISQLKRDGYKLAVCSNSVRESVGLMLQASGLDAAFDAVLNNEDVSMPKPDPEIYLKACSQMGVVPEETVIVEDSPYGIESARGSGAHVCVVNGFEDVDYYRIRDFISEVDK